MSKWGIQRPKMGQLPCNYQVTPCKLQVSPGKLQVSPGKSWTGCRGTGLGSPTTKVGWVSEVSVDVSHVPFAFWAISVALWT